MTVNLFVYGTLKKGQGNHRVLGENPKFIGHGNVKGFCLFDAGGFPYAVPMTEHHVPVIGEVYELPNLDRCDVLEGYPNHYNREEVMVDMGNGYISAWIYFTTDPWVFRYPVVEDGCWLP